MNINDNIEIKYNSEKNIKENTFYSSNYEENIKIKEFLGYLNDKEISHSIVKFFIGLRSANKLPKNPIELLNHFYSIDNSNDDKWLEIQDLEVNIENLTFKNEELKEEILLLKEDLETKRKLLEEEKLLLEQKLKEEEELKLKKSKKN